MRTKRMHHDPLLLGGGFRHTENDRVESWWRRNPSRQRTGMAGDRDLSWKTLSDLPDVSQDAQLFTRPVRGNRGRGRSDLRRHCGKGGNRGKGRRVALPVGHSLTLDQMRALGLYVSKPRSAQETDRPFPEPGLLVVNSEGKVQIVDISNAPFARP